MVARMLLLCGFEPDEAFKHISEKRGVQVPNTAEQIEWVVTSYNVLVNGT